MRGSAGVAVLLSLLAPAGCTKLAEPTEDQTSDGGAASGDAARPSDVSTSGDGGAQMDAGDARPKPGGGKDAGAAKDAGSPDAGGDDEPDAGTRDAGTRDAGEDDAGDACTPVAEICENDLDDDCDGKHGEAPSATTCCIDEHCGTDQRCEGGACIDKSWCERQSRPSGVAPQDYQCLDFDRGTSFAPWSPITEKGGTLSPSVEQAASPPASLYASVTGTDGLGRAKLRWNTVSSQPVTSLSLSASVHFHSAIGFHDFWLGHAELLCLNDATSSFCVNYSYPEDSTGWTLSLTETRVTSVAEVHRCLLEPGPKDDMWNRIELRVSTTGAPQVFLNDEQLSSPDCVFWFPPSTSVTAEVGLEQTAADEGWYLWFDDVQVSVKR